VGEAWEQMYRNEIEAQAEKLAPTPIEEGFKEFLDRKVPDRPDTKASKKAGKKAK